MPRIRTIKPETWEDEKLAKLKRECRLMFIGMFNFADDGGVIKSNPTYIKSRIFPYDEDLRLSDIKSWLDSLVKARMLVPFIHKTEGYFLIRTFANHQIIDKRYAKYAVHPDKVNTLVNKELSDHMVNTMGTHGEHVGDTPQEGKGIEGNREEEAQPGAPDVFSVAWDRWKRYKMDQYKFKYKSKESEDLAIAHLLELSDDDKDVAIRIIDQSIANSWKGFFELKEKSVKVVKRVSTIPEDQHQW